MTKHHSTSMTILKHQLEFITKLLIHNILRILSYRKIKFHLKIIVLKWSGSVFYPSVTHNNIKEWGNTNSRFQSFSPSFVSFSNSMYFILSLTSTYTSQRLSFCLPFVIRSFVRSFAGLRKK